jgi:hypothetical protein
MSLAAGALSKAYVGSSSAVLTSAVATGGTGPYTYQWYRSQTTGFSPGAGNIISGATALVLNDSGLLAANTYYYKVIATDTGNSNVTATSSQLTMVTEPAQNQNQFAIQSQLGIVDLKLGSTNVISAQVDSSVANNNPGVLFPGQAVKIVANTAGGVPRVAACSSNSDQCIGFVVYNIKDIQYAPNALLEMAMFGSVIWCYATGAVTQFAEACIDTSYVGGVQASGNSSTVVGWFVDGASAAGLVRVMLLPNYSFATA